MNRTNESPHRPESGLRRVREAAPALFAVLAIAGCTEVDPLLRLAEARALHEVRLDTWIEAAVERPEEAAPGEPGTPEETGEAEPPREAILSLFVASQHSPLELPCLTVDVVFTGGEEGEAELGRTTHELDISRIGEAGRSVDVTLRVPIPEGEVTGIYVETHDVELDALDALCEGEAIAGGKGAD